MCFSVSVVSYALRVRNIHDSCFDQRSKDLDYEGGYKPAHVYSNMSETKAIKIWARNCDLSCDVE